MYSRYIKSFLDRVIAFFLLLLVSPLLVLVAILIKAFLRTPIVFKQQRAGLHGNVFSVFKFSSMTNAKDANGQLLPDDERLTRLGLFLRKSSIDELPGLFNVLLGQMSLIGPRPLYAEYLPLYSSEQARRHEVRPGITGWAQVNGRNAISWEKKFELDVWYVEHVSFWLDMKILFLTVLKVLGRKDINSSEHATMAKFTGNDKRDKR